MRYRLGRSCGEDLEFSEPGEGSLLERTWGVEGMEEGRTDF